MENQTDLNRETLSSDEIMSITKKKLALALFFGSLLYVTIAFASQLIPFVLLGLPQFGITFIIVGLIQLTVGLYAITFCLRHINLKLSDVGFTTVRLGKDALIGASVAIIFALLQFLVIIPNTGGAERSDVVANSAQIGGTMSGLIGMLGLVWTSVFFEELFFRGFFFTTLRRLLGDSRFALLAAIIITVLFFGALHGYQGWSGIIDTALYGGLILTLLYVWRGRLTACIIAHALWNTLAVVGIYIWY